MTCQACFGFDGLPLILEIDCDFDGRLCNLDCVSDELWAADLDEVDATDDGVDGVDLTYQES